MEFQLNIRMEDSANVELQAAIVKMAGSWASGYVSTANMDVGDFNTVDFHFGVNVSADIKRIA